MKLSEVQLNELCKIAQVAAIDAGKYIQSQFNQHYVKQGKIGGDSLASQVVTEVDFKAQEMILDHLDECIKAYDLGLLTEESVDDHSRADKDYFWCIDPLDGTLPFTERRTGYAVSIALVTRQGESVVAIVYIPDLEECYTAVKGLGVILNEELYHRKVNEENAVFDIYWDISFKGEPYFDYVLAQFTEFVDKKGSVLNVHMKYGGVRNAIGVMLSKNSCYFKFPKKAKGCGSIWDYAATSLFFKELGVYVSDSNGVPMHLNNPNTTFMNQAGILYATNYDLTQFIIELGERVRNARDKG